MEQYILKVAVVAKIERRIKELQDLFKEDKKKLDSFQKTAIHLCIDECKVVLNILDTLEVKEVETWHLQEKEDIYDAVKDWGLYTFACIMKDGTIQKFIGSMDEDCEGHINVHIDGVNDDYDDVDDIVKWIEFT